MRNIYSNEQQTQVKKHWQSSKYRIQIQVCQAIFNMYGFLSKYLSIFCVQYKFFQFDYNSVWLLLTCKCFYKPTGVAMCINFVMEYHLRQCWPTKPYSNPQFAKKVTCY